MAAPNVDAFFLDTDGRLWMGTRGGGVRVLDGQKTFTYSVKDGLYDDDIFGIVADSQHNLWMACSKGVFFVSRADLQKFAAGTIKNLTSTPFSPTDALRTIECSSGVQPAAFRMNDGKVWFSTVHGVLVIDTEHLNLQAPARARRDRRRDCQRQAAQDPAHVTGLPHGQSNLDFRYTALKVSSPRPVSRSGTCSKGSIRFGSRQTTGGKRSTPTSNRATTGFASWRADNAFRTGPGTSVPILWYSHSRRISLSDAMVSSALPFHCDFPEFGLSTASE